MRRNIAGINHTHHEVQIMVFVEGRGRTRRFSTRIGATLVSGTRAAGRYAVEVDGSQLQGSGVYFYRMEAGGHVETRKMVFLK
ncbi:MAG: hypothetical protein WBG01_04715 [Bacteroidota bacterium]